MSRDKVKEVGAQRHFLNELYMCSLSSHISYKVMLTTWRDQLIQEGLYDNAVIRFNMADCNDKISLDFDIHNKVEMRNSLHKIDTIINTMLQMKQDVLTARKELRLGLARAKEIDEAEQNK